MIRATLLLALCFSALGQESLVPFFTDATYQRDEPANPAWFVHNNGQPSKLYHNGVFQSQETGLDDLGLPEAWTVQAAGAKVGVVDFGTHGDRTRDCVLQVSPVSEIFQPALSRYYPDEMAAALVSCVQANCRVVVFSTGFPTPNANLSNACLQALSCGVIVVLPAPNTEGNLDGALVDYPYAWAASMPNLLGANCTERNGLHYAPSATGTNVLGAPGRNIVAAGTYSSGTSWSAPILGGCVALLMERYPGQSPGAYIAALKATARGTAKRVDIVAALAVPVPRLSITPETVTVHGLPGWRYEVERSLDMRTWEHFGEVTGTSGLPAEIGYFRAKL